jgi:antitoxin ParD1/3/4
MAVRRTITVSITQEQDDLIKACLHSGHFASTSEVVRAALRLLQRDEVAQQVRKPRTACSKGKMHG